MDLKYIELKSDCNDRGPAWIALVQQSRTGRTVYFNGMALKRIYSGGISGNYYDFVTGEEYWVSSPKKRGGDRHWAGGGPILVQREAIPAYLQYRGIARLPDECTATDDIAPTDIAAFASMENAKAEE